MVVFGLALLLLIASPAAASDVEIDHCHFELSEVWKRANASFSIIAAFSVDPEGSPTDVKVLHGQRFVDPRAVEACIRSWKVPVVNANGAAVWSWIHGRGWQDLRILVGPLKLTVKSSGDLCPYLQKSPSV